MGLPERRADGGAILTLVAFNLAAYGRLLDPSRMLADYDALVYFFPLRAYAAMSVAEGRLPLWNPHSFFGVPFLANAQTALFYPGTWLFFWMPVPLAYGVSLALHVLLAGSFFYLFCRVSLAARPPAALVGGLALMLGGVLSGQYGHLNQVSAVAWLPLIMLVAERAVATARIWLVGVAGALVGLQLLAGHPQQSYMTLIAVTLVCLWRGSAAGSRGLFRALGVTATAALLGAAIAAAQLLPTAELAAVSIRGGGLEYRDAVANSLWPWLVARALLPSYTNDLGSTELLGYVGIGPLVLGVVALGAARARKVALGLVLALLGLFLAVGGANPFYPLLYAVVPGIDSFRVPARWLLLYTVGAASLAAVGTDWLLNRSGPGLTRHQWTRLGITSLIVGVLVLAVYLMGVRVPRSLQAVWLGLTALTGLLALACTWPRIRSVAAPALVVLVGLELWLAGGDLAPRAPVPVEAYAQPRDSTMFVQSRLGSGRFLSVAGEAYELKESPDYREWFGHLAEDTVTSFLVAAKRNEILTPNLNLLYRIDDADGYDGGLLPLRRWLMLGQLLARPAPVRADGVLISRMDSLPSRQLMDLLNLKVVLAGRSKDHEVDGVVYDRSVLVRLAPGERLRLDRVPGRSYTSVGLISAFEGDGTAAGSEIGQIELTSPDGSASRVPGIARRDTARAYGAADAVPASLEPLRPSFWTTDADPVEYLARIAVPPVELAHLAIVNTSTMAHFDIRAVTLNDERDGATTSLVLDDRLERTSFFEMKVYEYPGVLDRAYLVYRAIEADDETALSILANPAHQPRTTAVIEPGANLQLDSAATPRDRVEVIEYRPEHLSIRTSSSAPALLVVSDAYYPGWHASVDGQATRLIRTNIALRGVSVPAGEHTVTLSYGPASVWLGAVVSGIGVIVVFALVLLGRHRGIRTGVSP